MRHRQDVSFETSRVWLVRRRGFRDPTPSIYIPTYLLLVTRGSRDRSERKRPILHSRRREGWATRITLLRISYPKRLDGQSFFLVPKCVDGRFWFLCPKCLDVSSFLLYPKRLELSSFLLCLECLDGQCDLLPQMRRWPI